MTHGVTRHDTPWPHLVVEPAAARRDDAEGRERRALRKQLRDELVVLEGLLDDPVAAGERVLEEEASKEDEPKKKQKTRVPPKTWAVRFLLPLREFGEETAGSLQVCAATCSPLDEMA